NNRGLRNEGYGKGNGAGLQGIGRKGRWEDHIGNCEKETYVKVGSLQLQFAVFLYSLLETATADRKLNNGRMACPNESFRRAQLTTRPYRTDVRNVRAGRIRFRL